MDKLIDDDIRNISKVSIQTAAKYLGISANFVTLGMRNTLLPIGFAVKKDDGNRYSDSWTYAYSSLPTRACPLRRTWA